jgi:hypothetical protein
MSIVINNNASIADKEEHVFISDNERRVSIIEETSDIAGLGASLTKIISYKEDEENHDAEYNYNFIPTVSCDNYDYVNVYGHNQM